MPQLQPVKTFRRQWTPYCDHVDSVREIASWHESELHRLRVAYDVPHELARMLVYVRASRWECIESRVWALVSPEMARHLARKWLAAETARRWPEHDAAKDAEDNRVGIRRDGKLRTVRTR